MEKSPLEKVTKLKEIQAFRHEGFWQCMDHKIDKDMLDEMILENNAPVAKMKRLLVVGGTGFLGYHIISKAKKKNLQLLASLKKNQKKKDITKI